MKMSDVRRQVGKAVTVGAAALTLGALNSKVNAQALGTEVNGVNYVIPPATGAQPDVLGIESAGPQSARVFVNPFQLNSNWSLAIIQNALSANQRIVKLFPYGELSAAGLTGEFTFSTASQTNGGFYGVSFVSSTNVVSTAADTYKLTGKKVDETAGTFTIGIEAVPAGSTLPATVNMQFASDVAGLNSASVYTLPIRNGEVTAPAGAARGFFRTTDAPATPAATTYNYANAQRGNDSVTYTIQVPAGTAVPLTVPFQYSLDGATTPKGINTDGTVTISTTGMTGFLK